MVPNLEALSYPKSGTHFHAYLSLHKSAEGQARQALMLLLGLDPYVKLAVAVDADVDVFNEEEVLWALATRFQADTDMFMVPDVLCNRLDPSWRGGLWAQRADHTIMLHRSAAWSFCLISASAQAASSPSSGGWGGLV
jgi:UbiD family decarboxylase